MFVVVRFRFVVAGVHIPSSLLLLFLQMASFQLQNRRLPDYSCRFSSFCAVLSEQDSAAAQQYSRQGCPTGLRADMWALILNATNQPQVAQAHTACYVSSAEWAQL